MIKYETNPHHLSFLFLFFGGVGGFCWSKYTCRKMKSSVRFHPGYTHVKSPQVKEQSPPPFALPVPAHRPVQALVQDFPRAASSEPLMGTAELSPL